jgi:TetR/AcrR family transcriptional regulator, regulator of cefoperazone and chloramphenicol sensitivity
MRSKPDQADPAAKARIRDAAVVLFGEAGFAKASVRAVAEAAGVSPGLVIHYFGSKEGLRLACDDYVAEAIMGGPADASDGGAAGRLEEALRAVEHHRPEMTYLARVLHDGTEVGDHLFDLFVQSTRTQLREGIASGRIRPSSDVDALAVVVAAYGLVPLAMGRHLGRCLGTGPDGLSPELLERLALPLLELYTHGLYADASLLEQARTAEGNPRGNVAGR